LNDSVASVFKQNQTRKSRVSFFSNKNEVEVNEFQEKRRGLNVSLTLGSGSLLVMAFGRKNENHRQDRLLGGIMIIIMKQVHFSSQKVLSSLVDFYFS